MPQRTAIGPNQLLTGISRVSKSTALVLVLGLLLKNRGIRFPRGLRYLWLVLLLLQYKNLPLAWHITIFSPVLHIWTKYKLLGWGLLSPRNSKAKELGFPARDSVNEAIAINPFCSRARIETWHRVGLADSDFNLHKSNSTYATDLDYSRMEISMRMVAPLFVLKGFAALVGGVSYLFLKEIGMFQRYMVETSLVAYNDRWFFELHRFSLPLSHKRERDTIIKTSHGDRVLCTLALTKFTCRLAGKPVDLGRAISFSGFGPDGSNWSRTKQLRKEGNKAIRAFLTGETLVDSGVEQYQEQNQKALEIIGRLGGHDVKSVWLELARVHEDQV